MNKTASHIPTEYASAQILDSNMKENRYKIGR